MKIYKDDVIEALEDETDLGFGDFYLPPPSFISAIETYYNTPIGKCVPCAVGSVLRHTALAASLKRRYGVGFCRDITEGHYAANDKPKNYMSALSIFWESLGQNEVPVEEARRITIEWVEKTFPDDEVLGEV